MPLYVCRRFEGVARGLEGQALKWVRPKDMLHYPMPPADEPLIPFPVDALLTAGPALEIAAHFLNIFAHALIDDSPAAALSEPAPRSLRHEFRQ